MSVAINEKCECGSVAKVEDEELGRAMEVVALWRKLHEDCEDEHPEVTGTGSTAERAGRADPGHEQWDSFKKVPIVIAKVPFGFVRNEENNDYR